MPDYKRISESFKSKEMKKYLLYASLHPLESIQKIKRNKLKYPFYLEKKKLLRFALAAVLIRGKIVQAVQLTESFYPFVPYRNGRNYGSDGPRLQSSNVRLIPNPS